MIDANDEFDNNNKKFMGNDWVQIHKYVGNYQVLFKFHKIVKHKYQTSL